MFLSFLGGKEIKMIFQKSLVFSGIAFLLAFNPSTANSATVSVNSASSFTTTGMYLNAGEQFYVSASGSVNLATVDGPYMTDANGIITVAPSSETGAYNYFYNAAPSGAPLVGGYKVFSINAPTGLSVYGGTVNYNGGNYGALFGLFSSTDSPSNSIYNFSTALLLGMSGLFTAPVSGYLYLSVNDWNRGDNKGSFIASVSPVPLPAAMSLFCAGLVAMAGGTRLRRKRS